MTADVDEEARAALWRQQVANRIAFQEQLWLDLQAPPEPREQVIQDWLPVLLWQTERYEVTDPEDDP